MSSLGYDCLMAPFFGPFELDLAPAELRKSGIRVRIPKQPLRIVKTLLRRRGELKIPLMTERSVIGSESAILVRGPTTRSVAMKGPQRVTNCKHSGKLPQSGESLNCPK